MREFATKSAILKQIWAKASQIALLEAKIASPPPSFLVREAVPDCPPQRAIWDGCPSLPSTEGKLGRNRPRLPSRRAIWDDFGQRRAFWDAFGERPRVPSLTTNVRFRDFNSDVYFFTCKSQSKLDVLKCWRNWLVGCIWVKRGGPVIGNSYFHYNIIQQNLLRLKNEYLLYYFHRATFSFLSFQEL